MTHTLNDPATPDVLDPAPHRALAGDWSDDDGAAIDDEFLSMEVGPQVYNDKPPTLPATVPNPTRLLSRSLVVSDGTGVTRDPVMLFPADPHRKTLVLNGMIPETNNGEKTGSVTVVSRQTVNNLAVGTLDFTGINVPQGSTVMYDFIVYQAASVGSGSFQFSTRAMPYSGSPASSVSLAASTVFPASPTNTRFSAGIVPGTYTFPRVICTVAQFEAFEFEVVATIIPPAGYSVQNNLAAFTFASDRNSCFNGNAALSTTVPVATPITLNDHTGAVWLYSTSSMPVTVSAWAVTE